ncbi:MAG TPA: hypothetical protein VI299_02800 [Polyangiales bacterium]
MLPRVFFITILLAAAACSDPQCQSDELKVGTLCRATHTQADASSDAPDDSESGERMVADAGMNERDAAGGDASASVASTDDASTLLPSTHDAARPAGPDAILDALPGGPPAFQFRADTVRLEGENVAAIPNRRGSDALVISAGALAAPSGDALFGGAPTLLFTGTQWLDSNLPASAWKFTHDGTGLEVFNVYAPSDLSTLQVLGGTNGVSASPDQRGLYIVQNTSGSVRHTVFGTGSEICAGLTNAGALSVNVPSYIDFYYKENEPLEFASFAGALAGRSGNSSAAPDTVQDPFATLRFGARVYDGMGAMKMRWTETLIFKRVLEDAERQRVRDYIEQRYGIHSSR